jgi:hypothetical protein
MAAVTEALPVVYIEAGATLADRYDVVGVVGGLA